MGGAWRGSYTSALLYSFPSLDTVDESSPTAKDGATRIFGVGCAQRPLSVLILTSIYLNQSCVSTSETSSAVLSTIGKLQLYKTRLKKKKKKKNLG